MIIKMNGILDSIYFPVSSPFHSIDSVHKFPHVGTDIAMPTGTDVLSPDSGIIETIVHQGKEGLGEGIVMRLKDGKELIFGHLSHIDVKEGDVVSIGQKIADSGNTGHSTGDHLHIALKNIDGKYINPDHYAEMMTHLDNPSKFQELVNLFASPFKAVGNGFSEVMEFFSPFRDFFVWCGRIVKDVKSEGFLPWVGDQILYTLKMGVQAILYFDDLVFLMPAIASILAYFLIGKNKYTKYTLPLWFGYFVCEMIKATLK